MSLIYDRDIFAKFHALAITDVANIKVGETYYTNGYQHEFTVHEVISRIEHRKRWGREPEDYYTDEPCWMVTNANDEHGIMSLNDCNIGASYNPWLMFADKETAEQCCKELQIVYERDPWLDDRWEDYE